MMLFSTGKGNADSQSGKSDPVVRKISTADVGKGVRDFQLAPVYGILTGSICALVGLTIILTVYVVGLHYLAYPVAAGFAAICPFLAAGLVR